MLFLPVEFKYSPLRLIGFMFLGLVMTALCAVAATMLAKPDSRGQFVSFFGILLFGSGAAVIAWRIVNDRDKVVIRITQTGFTDRRIAPQEIPWRMIEAVGVTTIKRQKILVFDVNPAFERTLTLTRTVRWSRAPNAALGIRGLSTTTLGLDVDCQTVLDLCNARLRDNGKHDSDVRRGLNRNRGADIGPKL